MINRTLRNVAAMTVGLMLLCTTGELRAAETKPVADAPAAQDAGAPNPALAKFGATITFYASYDRSAVADLSVGDGQPVNARAPIKLQPGLRGNAFLAGQGAQAFSYQDKDNLNLSKSGALAVWISPYQWQRDVDKVPTFPIFSASSYGQWLLLARMGGKANQEKLYAFNQVGGSKSEQKTYAHSGNSLDWEDGEWHLLVCNWRDDAIEFSLDGATPVRALARRGAGRSRTILHWDGNQL